MTRPKLGRNLYLGIAQSLATVVAGLASVPFYIHYLGIEGYGMIGLFLALQGLLLVLDLGLAPAVTREVARSTAAGAIPRARNLLHTLTYLYWLVGAVTAVGGVLAAPYIGHEWLKPQDLAQRDVDSALALMALVAGCRWPAGLYLGALVGAERLEAASKIGMATTIGGHIAAILALALWAPTIQTFFWCQLLAAVAHVLLMRKAAWAALKHHTNPRIDFDEILKIWRFSAAMTGVAVTSTVFTQLDKVILSRILSLEWFGYYSLAALISGILYRLVTPLFNVIYPRFSFLVAAGESSELSSLYRIGTNGFVTLYFAGSMGIALGAEAFVELWTGNAATAVATAPLIGILTAGTALHGVMFFPYALQLAHGRVNIPLTINLVLVLVQVPLLVFLASELGAIGGAVTWLVLQILYLPLGTWLTHRALLPGIGRRWLAVDVSRPLIVTAFTTLVGRETLLRIEAPAILELLVTGFFCALAVALSFLFSPYQATEMRRVLLT
jgi:O-antigen/teichoic acid export membrane protein